MTKCSCSKGVCRSSTSFFYKVLASLKQLQCQKKHVNGATLEDIAKFMDTTYKLSGDIVSQVGNALCAAECSRFVVKKKNLYALVSPAATLQFTPGPCVKAKLERIQEIFNSKWYQDSEKDKKKSSKRKNERRSYSPPHFVPPTKLSSTSTAPSETKVDIKESNSDSALTTKPKPNKQRKEESTKREVSFNSHVQQSFKQCECPSTSKNRKKRKGRRRSSSRKRKMRKLNSSEKAKNSSEKARNSSEKARSSSGPCSSREYIYRPVADSYSVGQLDYSRSSSERSQSEELPSKRSKLARTPSKRKSSASRDSSRKDRRASKSPTKRKRQGHRSRSRHHLRKKSSSRRSSKISKRSPSSSRSSSRERTLPLASPKSPDELIMYCADCDSDISEC